MGSYVVRQLRALVSRKRYSSRKGKSRVKAPALQSHLSAGGDFLCTFEYGLYSVLVQSRSISALNGGARSDGRQRVASLPSHVFILTQTLLNWPGPAGQPRFPL